MSSDATEEHIANPSLWRYSFERNALTHCWHLSNHDAAESIGDTVVKEYNNKCLMLRFLRHVSLRFCSLGECFLLPLLCCLYLKSVLLSTNFMLSFFSDLI